MANQTNQPTPDSTPSLIDCTPDKAVGARMRLSADCATLIIELDLKHVGGASSEGKSIKVASLGRNFTIPGTGVTVSMNAWRQPTSGAEFDLLAKQRLVSVTREKIEAEVRERLSKVNAA